VLLLCHVDPARFELRKKRFTRDDVNEDNLKAYLASSSDDEPDSLPGSEGAQGRQDKLRALLLPSELDEEDEETERRDQPEGDMVISFETGLSQVGHTILEAKKQRDLEASETTWETYLRKRQEKQVAKKARRKASREEAAGGEGARGAVAGSATEAGEAGGTQADPFDDPFFADPDGVRPLLC
jgi:hypothetical protein